MNCTILGCDNPCEGTLWICATHNAEKRKAEKLANKVQIIKPIRKVSVRKAKELDEYVILKKQFLETKMACELRLPGCFLSSYEVHHCSISEKDFLNTETWLAVCRRCHSRLETEMTAEERREKGYLI